MFLHGSFFHIAGNMLYLWIFGNNVEDTLGHGRFILFYLASGVAAAATQTMASPGSPVPMIGASGAVSGVLGAYFLLFPHANVLTLVIFGFFWRIVSIPALVVLGFWMLVQILNGLGSPLPDVPAICAGMLRPDCGILSPCDPRGHPRSSGDRMKAVKTGGEFGA